LSLLIRVFLKVLENYMALGNVSLPFSEAWISFLFKNGIQLHDITLYSQDEMLVILMTDARIHSLVMVLMTFE